MRPIICDLLYVTIVEAFETPDLSESDVNYFNELKLICLKHSENIIAAYLNMNSIRNKLKNFSSIISEKFDVLAIAGRKIDSSFLTTQFKISGFKTPHRLDVSANGGRILVYVIESLISGQLDVSNTHSEIQVVPFE